MDQGSAAPADETLPEFKIRALRSEREISLGASNKILRLTTARYNSIVSEKPEAALRYVDEDDGELIQVGSAMELEQRLQEPPFGIARRPGLLHTFDISRSTDVVSLWRDVQTNRQFTKTSVAALEAKNVKPLDVSRTSSLKVSTWLSHQSHPAASLENHFPAAPIQQKTREADTALQSLSKQSALDPLTLDPHPVSTEQPLLQMFEAELAKLNESLPRQPESEIKFKEPETLVSVTDDPPIVTPDNVAAPETLAEAEKVNGTAASTSQTPGEVLAKSLRGLFDGLGLLTSTIVSSNGDLRHHLALAQRDFPQNIEQALQASIGTLDALREAVVPPKSAWASQQQPSNVEPAAEGAKATGSTATQIAAEASAAKSAAPAAETNEEPSKPFEAERILARRYITYGYVGGPEYKQYLVRWADHGPEEDVWYDAENLWGCQRLVEQFEKDHADPLSHEQKLDLNRDVAELHCRTAGERMVTFKRPSGDRFGTRSEYTQPATRPVVDSQAPSAVSTKEQHPEKAPSEETVLQDQDLNIPQSSLSSKEASSQPSKSDTFSRRGPHRSKSLRFDDRRIESFVHASDKEDGGRQSQQQAQSVGNDSTHDSAFHFSPSSVMQRYPTINQLERAATVRDGKRRQTQAFSSARPASMYSVDPSLQTGLQSVKSRREMAQHAYDQSIRRTRSLALNRARASFNSPSLTSLPSQVTQPVSSVPGQRMSDEARHQHDSYLPSRRADRVVEAAQIRISECVARLVDMGFPSEEACHSAEACDGDLPSAIDLLQEDRAARRARQPNRRSSQTRSHLPGSWETWGE